MRHEQITASLRALIVQGEKVLTSGSAGFVPTQPMVEWSTTAATLIRSVFGVDSEYYRRLAEVKEREEYLSGAQTIQATIQAALFGWENGFMFELRDLVRADVEGDLVGQAETLLEGGYDRAAAVVAGATLEEHLRAIAPSWGVAVQDSRGKHLTLEPLNIELKKAGAYDGIMQKRITLLGGLRNEAAHANPFENRHDDVQRMIRDVVDVCDRVRAK